MRIISSTIGNYINDPFKKTAVCANAYIPIYAFHFRYTTENIEFYNRPTFDKGCHRKANTLKNVKAALEMYVAPVRIPIGSKFYYFMKGAMYTEEGIPMMVLAIPRKDYQDPNIRKFSDLRYGQEVNPVDYKNFVLFYSTSFFTDPSLAALNRRFQKEILIDCYTKGIEVRVITSSEIEKNTFASLFEIPKANSVSQLEEYMSTVLPTYLYTEEEDTFVFKELRAPEIVQDHELSVEEEALLFDSELEELPELDPIPYYTDEYAMEREELEREAATWESAHTDYQLSMPAPAPQTAQSSFVERVMNRFNNLVITGESVVHADYAIANADAALTAHVQQTMRNNRPIELIDDTE
jgi:hypothetical protein